jgi:hypothetical protein
MMRMLDAARDFAAGKTPVTYIENHDHETITLNAGSRDEWYRLQPYLIALLTTAGAPQIHAGLEFAEIYPMPENDLPAPPDSTDPNLKRVVPRPLHWSFKTDGPGSALLDKFRRLIDIRNKHQGLTSPNFHPRGWDGSRTRRDGNGFGIDTARQVVVYHRWGQSADDRLEKFFIVLNFSQGDQPVDMSFPEDGGWVDLISGWQPPVHNNWLHFNVGPNWGHIFYKKY